MIKPEELAFIKGYTIDKDGNLLNRNGIKVKGCRKSNKCDYLCFNIRTGPRNQNKILKCMFHRFQAYIKYGNQIYGNGIVVRHLNGNRYDNSYDNISIGTFIDNKRDIPKELISIHCGHIKRIYEPNIVESIRKDRNDGYTYSQLMSKYNISSKGTIHYIINREDTLYKTYPNKYTVSNNTITY